MSEDESITLYWDNAQRTLSKAQLMCQKSQNMIADLQSTVTAWQKTISKIQFTICCIDNQTIYLAKSILEGMIGKRLLEKEWERNVLDNLSKEMKRLKEEILAKMEILRDTKHVLGDSDETLADFISMGNLNILNEKFRDLDVINTQVINIRSQHDLLLKKVLNQLLKNKIRKLKHECETYFGSEGVKFISEKSYGEIIVLEEELVELLRSLTDHYDKCKLLKSGTLPSAEYAELLRVVANDNDELDKIMGILNDAVDDISRLAEGIYATIQQKEKEKQHMKSSMLKVANELKKYEDYLLVFQGIEELISKFKQTCIQDIAKVQELSSFYDNFLSSYKHLLEEVERRSNVAKQMKRIIERCEEELKALTDEDLKARQMFLLEHGDYLPENIWPGHIDDLEPLYKLSHEIKEI
ncbi:HCL253Wp [Eremothecium sinecaudum]|uniref:Autophagy-related protein 17 n=1 Tax=Eremothecium sinecaudum TaxID=45286 RepID=A0A0X8HR57_9SACH|nr:HCL253Wp [Eremothecium sinecaudum]AMD19898.1 HCL253Wp [Eremothecium sinecaudum]